MRVLEYFHERFIAHTGGPSGYLYNLRVFRDQTGDREIFFLNDQDMPRRLSFRVKNKLHGIASDRSLPETAARVEQIFYESTQKGPYDLSSFDIVHFHSTADLFAQKKNLEDFAGKVVLTSHTPKAPHREWIEDLASPSEYEAHREILDKTVEFDEFAFSRADYVVFPCREAEEPYFHTWKKYAEIRDEKKILYLPTGIPDCRCGGADSQVLAEKTSEACRTRKSRAQIRGELAIPEEAFVLCFVGRHNSVKGYDRLISIFEKLPEVTVICCGNEGRIASPISPRWIEVGWTEDPFSYIAASDLFVLPNRETYFDLTLLEVLSLGKLSLISRTGGNKVFCGKEDCGIFTFETEEEAEAVIRKLMEERDADSAVAQREEKQRVLFEQEYSMEKFYARYKELLEQMRWNG